MFSLIATYQTQMRPSQVKTVAFGDKHNMNMTETKVLIKHRPDILEIQTILFALLDRPEQ